MVIVQLTAQVWHIERKRKTTNAIRLDWNRLKFQTRVTFKAIVTLETIVQEDHIQKQEDHRQKQEDQQ